MLDALTEALLGSRSDHLAIEDERGGGIRMVEVEAENCGHQGVFRVVMQMSEAVVLLTL